jgi:hypothetical protein
MLDCVLPIATGFDCPLAVPAAATDAEAEADRGPAAERAEDAKNRRRPNRLTVSPQAKVISTAARTVRTEIRAILRPLNGLGVSCVSAWLCRIGSEDIYIPDAEYTSNLLYKCKGEIKTDENLLEGKLIK